MILVDTNILLDVVTDDPAWADWSQQQLEAAALRDRLAINPVVYAEFSAASGELKILMQCLLRWRLAWPTCHGRRCSSLARRSKLTEAEVAHGPASFPISLSAPRPRFWLRR